ncbi:MAG: IclR family transcriptional regulator [Chloroflexi bacterium]|nr:IclR family transcriptional regulator [Chloroflexota bacterium]
MRRSGNQTRRATGHRPDGVASTIGAGLRVLSLFNHLEPEWTIRDIAVRLDLPYSTAYRYVASLEAEGYLVRHRPSGTFRLGLPLIELAGVVLNQLEVRVQGLSLLDQLADATGLNANMAVLYEGDTFHIAYAVRSAVPRMYTALGRRAVAHCTALGKVLLADLPFEEVRQLIERYGWRPYTPRSIQSFDVLARELEEVRARGYAVDRGERSIATRCVAAPVRDRSGRVVAAISISGTQESMPEERIPDLALKVQHYAAQISYRLGYDQADPAHVIPLC